MARRYVRPPPPARRGAYRRRGGTFAPFSRASSRPIAIACSRLFTFPPRPPFPLLNVPFFRRRIALSTLFDAFLPYRRVDFFRVDFFAVDFLAVDLRVDFFAADLFEVDLRVDFLVRFADFDACLRVAFLRVAFFRVVFLRVAMCLP
jgi:hypothetical protein